MDFKPEDETPAWDNFALHYNKLKQKHSVVTSAAVSDLLDGVYHGYFAIVAFQRHDKTNAAMEDQAGNLQMLIFRSANWLLRFNYHRANSVTWFDIQERKEAGELANTLRADAAKLLRELALKKESVIKEQIENEADWKAKDVKMVLDIEQRKTRKLLLDDLDRTTNTTVKQIKILNACLENLAFAWREVDDCRNMGEILDDRVKHILERAQMVLGQIRPQSYTKPPAWRVNGITELGPFKVRVVTTNASGKDKPLVFVECAYASSTPIQLRDLLEKRRSHPTSAQMPPGTYSLISADTGSLAQIDADRITSYAAVLGGGLSKNVQGKLSPLSLITIDYGPTHKLIRIPKAAKYFCWAYPVVTSKLEIHKQDPSDMDAFLLFGGYVYFDKDMKAMQCNAINLQGSQLQFSSPCKLGLKIVQELEKQNRFAEITFENMLERGATHFAWLLPSEFSESALYEDDALPVIHPGAFAYKYDDDPSKNNYFVLASVNFISGEAKAAAAASMPEA